MFGCEGNCDFFFRSCLQVLGRCSSSFNKISCKECMHMPSKVVRAMSTQPLEWRVLEHWKSDCHTRVLTAMFCPALGVSRKLTSFESTTFRCDGRSFVTEVTSLVDVLLSAQNVVRQTRSCDSFFKRCCNLNISYTKGSSLSDSHPYHSVISFHHLTTS